MVEERLKFAWKLIRTITRSHLGDRNENLPPISFGTALRLPSRGYLSSASPYSHTLHLESVCNAVPWKLGNANNAIEQPFRLHVCSWHMVLRDTGLDYRARIYKARPSSRRNKTSSKSISIATVSQQDLYYTLFSTSSNMRSFALIAGLAALAVASPMPQDLNDASKIDLAVELPSLETVEVPIGSGSVAIPFDPAAAAAAAAQEVADSSSDIVDLPDKRSLEQRAACDPQPAGLGPKPATDSSEAFMNFLDFSTAATTATTPSGYVQTFQDQKASLEGCGYMGYSTYATYDVLKASQDCSKITGCKGFNIFYERDPSVEPGYTNCKDPSSTTMIKASFWGNNVAPLVATNYGQYRSDFHVVIAGSNGYSLTADAVTPIPIKGYTQQVLGGCSINSKPTACTVGTQKDSFQRSWTSTDAFFDHGRCQAICDSTTNCRFFTSYMLVTNGKCGVQQCAFYKRAWSQDYCTNKGQFNAQGDKVTIQWSSSFTSTKGDNVAVCPIVTSSKLFRS
jgi:hypothetical protein